MPKPSTKVELLERSQNNYKRLNNLIDSYPKDVLGKEFSKGTLNRNICDVLAHLHHWHLMFLTWYEVGMNAGKPEMPAKGYTWKTLPDLNIEIWKKYQKSSLHQISLLLSESYSDVQMIIKRHSNDELFEKKKYKWTGSTSLGAYLISNTSSHYDWAYKRIKKSMK